MLLNKAQTPGVGTYNLPSHINSDIKLKPPIN